jgi:hypothetical protein
MDATAKNQSAKLQPLVDAARSYVIPLFAALGRRRFTSSGSAVLITTGARFYAFTAGHVLDAVAPDPLFTWSTKSIGSIRLKYAAALTSEPRMARRRDDRVDLAAFPIDTVVVEKLIAAGAMFAPDSLLSDEVDQRALYAFVGYPHSANEIKRAKSESGRLHPVIPNVATFAPARHADVATYASVNADPRLNFVAHFNHSAERREDAPARPMPHPRGMSGGAAYCLGLSPDLTAALDALRLVGIGTEYHPREGLLVAANTRAVRHLISAFETGLSSA